MKKKIFRIVAIIVGVLVLLIILIWPAAPLWVRLGAKPVCIQEVQGKIKVVSCPDVLTPKTAVTPYPLPTPGSEGPVPVLFDDDGSPDGMIALLFFLSDPSFEVQAVTISQGEAHPELFAGHVSRILSAFDKSDIPVGYGRDTPLAGDNAFPEPWRDASDVFWNVQLPGAQNAAEPHPAAKLMVDTLMGATQPALVFVSGTHTDLAEALRLEPGIAAHIRGVYMMGGSIYVPGNIESDWPEIHNKVAEWNIWVDPQAASEVFASGLPLHLIPLDATNQVTWSGTDVKAWQVHTTPENTLAGDLVTSLLRSWSVDNIYIWDLVAAVSATDPRLCLETQLSLEVVTAPGLEQGRIAAGKGPANAWVCLNPDAAQIKARVRIIFNQ